jgi:aldehyde dehydrogenase (NAD+)
LVPLIDAIASGNTAIVFLPHQTQFINKTITNILGSVFKDEHVICINKDLVPYENLFDVKYDFVFFTGSYNVGKIIAQQCANTLTPYTLELGGKNPTIITKDANLNLAAKRIARAK